MLYRWTTFFALGPFREPLRGAGSATLARLVEQPVDCLTHSAGPPPPLTPTKMHKPGIWVRRAHLEPHS